MVTSDKKVRKVPEPKMPENTTPYEIDNRQFLSNPDGQQGYGYYLHLSQPQKAYRMVIKIRSSGGQGYIRVNAKSSPNQGEQVAQFEFDASGTTEIKFNKAVETQDILLWGAVRQPSRQPAVHRFGADFLTHRQTRRVCGLFRTPSFCSRETT